MPSTLGLSPLEVVQYEPGVCNIGKAEIDRRRKVGWIGAGASVALLAVLLAAVAPAWTRLLMVAPAGVAAEGFLQAQLHFCAGFAAAGVYNFGEVGTTERIIAGADRARDVRRAMTINVASLAIGISAGLVAFLLPVR